MQMLLAISLYCSALAASATEPPAGLGEAERQQGFVSLFDGRSLDGWQGSVKGYVPENGLLVCLKKGGGKLFTTREYGDFVFRFEFKLEPGGNNGVGIRMPAEGNAAYGGMEIQILDDTGPIYKNLQPYQYHGSIYGVVPAKRGHLNPVGQWNREEIMCQGPRVRVTLNDAVIVDADLSQIAGETIDHREHPGLRRPSGFLGFLGHGARIEFRNLRIKELK